MKQNEDLLMSSWESLIYVSVIANSIIWGETLFSSYFLYTVFSLFSPPEGLFIPAPLEGGGLIGEGGGLIGEGGLFERGLNRENTVCFIIYTQALDKKQHKLSFRHFCYILVLFL